LEEQARARPPYHDTRRLFWFVDHGSAHRGRTVQRLQDRYPRSVLVHAPVHARWLNQVEIYFSIVQRKVLSPNDFTSPEALAERLLDFQYYWESAARPFQWKFTGQNLANLLTKLGNQPPCSPAKIRDRIYETMDERFEDPRQDPVRFTTFCLRASNSATGSR
jgi:hypothetical protein